MRGSHQDSFSNNHEQKQPTTEQPVVQHDTESRLAKVKRVLLGCSSGSNSGSGNNNNGPSHGCFGQELELADKHNETGVPLVVHRLCSFIEAQGSRDPALFRPQQTMLAVRLRLSFERRNDADLEATSCPPSTAASLLRQYLLELPRPVVEPEIVTKLLQLYSHERGQSREHWIEQTRDLLVNELPVSNFRLLGYLLLFLGRSFDNHLTTGICASLAPVLLPHVPPATVLMRDLLLDVRLIFNDFHGVKDSTVNGVITSSDCKDPNDDYSHTSDKSMLLLVCPTKPPKRKDRRDSCGQERKLIRSNSEEKIWEKSKRTGDEENNSSNSADTIRRVSSHEDFNSAKHHHILSKLQKEMGHGLRPLQERTNVSPVSSKTSLVYSQSAEAVLATEKYNCDAERLRNSERFSRSITPRGRRQVRRKKLFLNTNFDQGGSKENDSGESEKIFTLTPDAGQNQSFLEMLSSGPSRSPSPSRPPFEHDDGNNPTLANWSFQSRQSNDDMIGERVEAMISPRNSVLIPRRFYSEASVEDQENMTIVREYGLKSLVKQINSLKKKIKKYEGEFEDNFGYRPSHSDKMSNRDIKKIISELNKVRKEHKILKEGFISTLLGSPKLNRDDDAGSNNNNNNEPTAMSELVKEVDRKLADKRSRYNRPENMEDLTYEQLLDEKTAVQKALLHIENTLGRPVSKEDRSVVRPLYDRYRTLKRLLIRAGANRQQDSMSELATILEHETMDFSSASGTPVDCAERRASEPDMSHRGILDCIDSIEPTDSDSQHSSSESSRGIVESLHSLSRDELLQQQRVTKEEKKRLRRALKELEMQFEARAGRRMKREDRGSQVNVIYDSYKQTKAKLRLISALLAKSS